MRDLRKGIELANRYTLVRKLGSGGAAETWLARDRLTKSDVALKILASDKLSRDDFRREWQTSIRLVHAHIVRVFEFHDDVESEPPFYSLQYLGGPDIGALTGAPVEDILPPVAAIADALRYAHARDVVHRDIKAGNVLLDHNGAPYLVDFGIARAHGEGPHGGSLIAASPQSLDGAPVSPADDIFALGGLVYELVSGRSPYSSEATADDIRHGIPPRLEAADGSPVPTALQDLVARMLDKDPAARPDASAVCDALAAAGFSAGPAPARYAGVVAPADEVIEIGDAPRHRRPEPSAAAEAQAAGGGLNPRSVGISLAVLVLLLLGVVFLLPGTVEVEQAAPVATEAEEGEATGSGRRRSGVEFTENVDDLRGRDERVQARADTERVLGELLSKMETLERRAVQRWGGLRFTQAQAVYAEGDAAYLDRNYAVATEKYEQAIEIVEPLLDEVDQVFADALNSGLEALEIADTIEALRHLELAAAISPSHAGARAALSRARNLDTVLALTDQGLAYENDLELDAARRSFEEAADLDPDWEPAQAGLARVLESIRQMEFDQRMSEGLMALEEGDFPAARAAFRMAEQLRPGSPEVADGLLQVDQGIRLEQIRTLERQAMAERRNEEWETAIETYERILEIDPNLQFAQQGLRESQAMAALHAQLDEYITNPDSLSEASTMGRATRLVVDITRMPEPGPRLTGQRDELSRLLKRAATPLTVELVSDNVTDVSIYKVGKLGSFESTRLELRPGTYVAVGSRPGYRDVRLEFRVAPEIDMQPVIVRCEETI
jgi:tetratricopeptide (TPR) repeat protein